MRPSCHAAYHGEASGSPEGRMVPFRLISTIHPGRPLRRCAGAKTMALNIKDRETERLAAEVAALAGESKTRAVKVALQERRARLAVHRGARDRHADLVRFLETEVWPQ